MHKQNFHTVQIFKICQQLQHMMKKQKPLLFTATESEQRSGGSEI